MDQDWDEWVGGREGGVDQRQADVRLSELNSFSCQL